MQPLSHGPSPGCRLVLGVDFTSAPSARKPITVAVGRCEFASGTGIYRLEEVRGLETLAAFEEFLAAAGEPWLGGFDLPFGQPRRLIEHEGWPTDWPQFVRFYCSQPRQSLREVFRRWCDARPAGDKFAWRQADKPAGSSPAMRWTNPPVAWMMHAGIGRMLDAGLAFPAHAHAGTGLERIALEAYPGFTARQVCRRSYKSDAAAGRTEDRAANRRVILRALVAGSAGLAVALVIRPAWSRRLADDCRGDLLDAVICGLQAAHAATRPGYGLPAAVDPLEGWIASVPPPAGGQVRRGGGDHGRAALRRGRLDLSPLVE